MGTITQSSQSRSYHEFPAWQVGIDLVKDIYDCTDILPVDEKYGLVSQMRKAAVSIPSNIAEGVAQPSKEEYSKFLTAAHTALCELETKIIICSRLNYLTDTREIMARINRVFDLLSGLMNSVKC